MTTQRRPKGHPAQPVDADEEPALESRRVEYLRLDQVQGAPRNPKGHAQAAINQSISRFGLAELPLLDGRTGRLVAGHGRLDQLTEMHAAGQTPPEGVRLDPDGSTWLVPVITGWSSRSDVEAEAYLVASNQLTIAGGWDDGLADLLYDIQQVDPSLMDLLGFEDDDLAELLAAADGNAEVGGEDLESDPDDGALVELAGTTLGEPDYVVTTGEQWWMGDRHVLVVGSPHTDWPLWVDLLEGDAVFLPFPSPMAPLVEQPPGRRVVMVHPNTYLAGWVLTRWARVTGGTPEKVEP